MADTPHADEGPARDQDGHPIGGVTAHAPGIRPGDTLSTIQGAAATNADDVAAELRAREGGGDDAPMTGDESDPA